MLGAGNETKQIKIVNENRYRQILAVLIFRNDTVLREIIFN